MASVIMGPPSSPKERRSTSRRSFMPLPIVSSTHDLPRPRRSSISKRFKEEDNDEEMRDSTPHSANGHSSSTPNGTANGRGKRSTKNKDKEKQQAEDEPTDTDADGLAAQGDDEEQGVTRCVCGSTGDDDPDAGEFMVQCETCNVWQHGLCMGFEQEDQLPDDEYHCEQCKPELHSDLLKKLAKRARQSARPNSTATNSRHSRSTSPAQQTKQASKRRNTMNSRDAAFDEITKEIMEASAAEAAAANGHVSTNGDAPHEQDDAESSAAARKKRKRTEDEPVPNKKRTRSASTTPDRAPPSASGRDDTPVANQSKPSMPAPPVPPKARAKRGGGGRKSAAANDTNAAEGEEAPPHAPPSRRGNGRRGGAGSRRPPSTTTGDSKRNNNWSNSNDGRHRQAHLYPTSQQGLYTSWHLPDYLAHLEHILPTGIPVPLQVYAGAASGNNNSAGTASRDSVEYTTERGVKVKWPAKRMSVGDMNKRVRALVEWVGREQANAQDRTRRKEALEKELEQASVDLSSLTLVAIPSDNPNEPSTMKMMEELMEELINFQEKFGPGAKSRERRLGSN